MSDDPSGNRSIADTTEEISPIARDLKQSGLGQRDALLEVAAVARLWRSKEGEAFATVPVNGHEEHLPIRSPAFRFWLRARFSQLFQIRGRPAGVSEHAVVDACRSIEALATANGLIYPAPLRVGEIGGAIYIDLGKPDCSLVKITPACWSIVPTSPEPVIRGRRTAPFPAPAARGDLDPLQRLLSHLDEDTRTLIISWSIGALLPRGPYPILVLCGEQGSGKSTITRMLQRLTDPVEGDVLPPPTSDRDLIAMAKARRVLPFDNVSGINPGMADNFCRLSSGGEIGGRALYTDHESASFRASRAIILNGISGLATRADLADRAIVIRLPRLPSRSTERDLDEALENALPQAFSAILDAIRFAMEALPRTPVPAMRMADFGRFIVAAEPALNWPPGTFQRAYENMHAEAIVILAEGDWVTREILRLMHDRGEWYGLKGELLDELTSRCVSAGRLLGEGRMNYRSFGVQLSRATPALRSLGIEVLEQQRLTIGQPVVLRRVPPIPTFATLATSAESAPTP